MSALFNFDLFLPMGVLVISMFLFFIILEQRIGFCGLFWKVARIGFVVYSGRQIEQLVLFDFRSFLIVVLLMICTCTYIKMQLPTILKKKTGFRRFFWKAARIGERLSPWVALGCFVMGVSIIIF